MGDATPYIQAALGVYGLMWFGLAVWETIRIRRRRANEQTVVHQKV